MDTTLLLTSLSGKRRQSESESETSEQLDEQSRRLQLVLLSGALRCVALRHYSTLYVFVVFVVRGKGTESQQVAQKCLFKKKSRKSKRKVKRKRALCDMKRQDEISLMCGAMETLKEKNMWRQVIVRRSCHIP